MLLEVLAEEEIDVSLLLIKYLLVDKFGLFVELVETTEVERGDSIFSSLTVSIGDTWEIGCGSVLGGAGACFLLLDLGLDEPELIK